MDRDHFENISDMEKHGKLPIGWLIMAIGLVLFGIYYFIAYTPQISGWTQMQQFEEAVKE